jgi:hypothetical protein
MKSTTVSFVAAAVLLGASASHAQPRTVTRDELRACMNSEDDIAARRKALDEHVARRKADESALRAETDEIKAQQEHADEDQFKRRAFDRRVKAYQEKVKAFNAAGPALNTELDEVKKAIAAHNDKCGGIAFSPEDKEAVQKEREAAKK